MPETTQYGGNNAEVHGDQTLPANYTLHQRYKVLGILGNGGMGTVYQARDINFAEVKRLVAVKEMLNPSSNPAAHSATLKTFQREANILAALDHPSIPKIYDFFDEGERVYLVMEYIHGTDVETLLNKVKEVPMEKIVDWAIELCEVMTYLHTQSSPIVFRDLKPSNIMIDKFGKLRLIDFGIAKIFTSGVKHTMIGTEGYCGPEQYKGNVTTLSDIYSFGATFHHIITRKDPRLAPPFTFSERPIASYNAKTPDILVQVIDRSLEYDPPKRFQSFAEIRLELEKLRQRPNNTVIESPAVAALQNTVIQSSTGFFDENVDTGYYRPKWTFKVEDEIRCSPATLRELAFVGAYDTNMWAVKVETGEMVWKYPSHGGIASSPAVDDKRGLVLFGSDDNTFYAVDYRTGRLKWTQNTKDKVRGPARTATDLDAVFFGSDDGNLYAMNTTSGRLLWKFEVAEPIRSRPAIFHDTVIVGTESGEIFGINIDGKRKWSYRTRRPVTSSPYVDEKEGMCYVGSGDNFLYALDANNGYSAWRYRTGGPIISSPSMNRDLVYIASVDGVLYAINAQNGREKWKFKPEAGKPFVASPVAHQNVIYIGSTDEHFYAVDAPTGKQLWKIKTGGAITSTACIADKFVLFGSLDKTLYALPLTT